MIELIVGKIGGGKTYLAVMKTLKALAEGQTVYTNIEWDYDQVALYLAVKHGIKFKFTQLISLPTCDDLSTWWEVIEWGDQDCSVLVIIDEGHLWYNSHDWKKTATGDKQMCSFMTQSRKAGVDLIFITQVAGTINKGFRDQSEFFWTAVNLKKLRVPFFGAIFGNAFLWLCRDPRTNLVMERRFAYFSLPIGKCYKTDAFLDQQMQDMAALRVVRVKRIKHKKVTCAYRIVAYFELGYPSFRKWNEKRKLNKKTKNEILDSNNSSGGVVLSGKDEG